ncbi:MAG: thiamine biosynthesis protein ThiS [Chloroflexi bacterium HGW-Chloroflexi-8]|jgi:sulfur carrier protein ThiS|nr:MAG: thiamine biosynthesis protein ThiS [Chloroflexi bacterium HGW-Chloroflexi-8]
MSVKLLLRKQEFTFDDVINLTVAKALKQLDLIPEAYLVIRSGEMLTEHELIREGDVLRIIPVVSGGNE